MEPSDARIVHRRARTTAARAVAAVERELCGEPVTQAEFDEFERTGVCPARILKPHTWPEPAAESGEPKQEPMPWD